MLTCFGSASNLLVFNVCLYLLTFYMVFLKRINTAQIKLFHSTVSHPAGRFIFYFFYLSRHLYSVSIIVEP